jgi:hypothetical protein
MYSCKMKYELKEIGALIEEMKLHCLVLLWSSTTLCAGPCDLSPYILLTFVTALVLLTSETSSSSGRLSGHDVQTHPFSGGTLNSQ